MNTYRLFSGPYSNSNYSSNTSVSSPASLAIAAVAGISVAITFVVSFSLGAMMAIICVCLRYISRQQRKNPVIGPTSTETYDVVGPKKTQQCNIKMETNTSYGVPLSSPQSDM